MKIVLRAPRAAALLPQVSIQGIVVSVILHVALAGLVAVVASSRPELPRPERIYTVSLVADPTPGRGGGAPHVQPAAPEPVVETEPPPAPEPEPKVEAPPEKPKPPPPEPDPEPEPVQTREPEPEIPARDEAPAAEPSSPASGLPVAAAAPDRREPPSPVGEGSGLAAGTGGDSEGVPTIDSAAFPFAYYRAILTDRLRSTWSRPLLPGGLSAPIRVTVRFEVLRGGAIADVSLVTSSGYSPLDRSALRAIYDANPLPPLPEQYDEPRLAVHFFFELVPD